MSAYDYDHPRLVAFTEAKGVSVSSVLLSLGDCFETLVRVSDKEECCIQTLDREECLTNHIEVCRCVVAGRALPENKYIQARSGSGGFKRLRR